MEDVRGRKVYFLADSVSWLSRLEQLVGLFQVTPELSLYKRGRDADEKRYDIEEN